MHRRDIKKIPMTEKVSQLYKEEQIGKVRQGRKAIPDNKMPNLGWDAMEEVNTYDTSNATTKGTVNKTNTVQLLPETITAIAILIVTFLETLRPQLQKLFQIGKNIAQTILKSKWTNELKQISQKNQQNIQKIAQKVIKPMENR